MSLGGGVEDPSSNSLRFVGSSDTVNAELWQEPDGTNIGEKVSVEPVALPTEPAEWPEPREETWVHARLEDGIWKPRPQRWPLLVSFADVKREPVSWLWKERIPMGALTIIDGEPKRGKSLITLDLAARITRSRRMPDESLSAASGGSVILIGSEDSPATTILPRLEAAGADFGSVHALTGVASNEHLRGQPFTLPFDLDALEQAIIELGASCVVIDPILAHIDRSFNSNLDQDVRQCLTPLAQLGRDYGVSIIGIRHIVKGTRDAAPIYKGGGSMGIIGVARSGLLVQPDADDPGVNVLAQIASNLGRLAPPMPFRLRDAGHGEARIDWL